MLANIILGLTIAFLPLMNRITSIDFTRESKDFLFITIAFIILATLKETKRRLPFSLLIASIYIVIMITFNQHVVTSLNVILHTIEISAGWFLFVKYYMCHDNNTKHFVFIGAMIGACIQSIISILQYYGFDLYFYIISLFVPSRLSGTGSGCGYMIGSFGNNNLLSSYLCMTIPMFFAFKRLRYLSILPITALLMTQTFMGIISLLMGLLYLISVNYNIISKAKIYMMAIAGMIILPFFNIGIDSGRFPVWRTIISSASLKHWLIGMGPGWFPDQLMDNGIVIGVPFLQEHNSYLSIFNVFGIIGFLILIPPFVRFLKYKTSNYLLEAIAFIIFCNSWGHFAIQQSTVVIIIIPTIALLIGEVYENAK